MTANDRPARIPPARDGRVAAAPDPGVSRRTLLQTAAGVVLTGAGLAGASAPRRAAAQTAVFQPDHVLNVEMAQVDPVNPPEGLRTYNGKAPGPVLRVEAGKPLKVRLVNRLAPQPPDRFCPEDHNTFHGENTTNLHTHGLHVSPNVSVADPRLLSDNIFVQLTPKDQPVPPGCDLTDVYEETADYSFDLPADHPSGTFWYHAHKHGSTALQVGNGMAGPLIVPDRPSVMPSYIADAKEDILMIMLRDIERDVPQPAQTGGSPTFVLVDPSGQGGGIKNPVIELRPGEVRRWRIINASVRTDSFLSLNLEGGAEAPELYQIAFDGLTLNRRLRVDTSNTGEPWVNPFALAPGNRTDFMVRVPRAAAPGTFRLTALAAGPQHLMAEVRPQANPIGLTVRIAGEPVDDAWAEDDALPGPGIAPIDPETEPPALRRTVVFDLQTDRRTEVEGSFLTIDGQEFDGRVKKSMRRGTVEEWTVMNVNTFTHPFHIHVNPFFVTHINGRELAADDPLRRWQDTVALPTAPVANRLPLGSVTFRSRYQVFTGAFVIHCHILGHEDQGMMQKVEVVA